MKRRYTVYSLAALILACLMLLPMGVSANAGRDYGESVRALGKEDWQKAELKIRDALAKVDHAQAEMELSGGVRFPYMPWFVLGSALQGKGDCAGAVTAWQRSLENGIVQSSEREHQLLLSGMKQCEAQMARVDLPASQVIQSPSAGGDSDPSSLSGSQAALSAHSRPATAQLQPPDEGRQGNNVDSGPEHEKERLEQERIEEQRRATLLAQRQEAERRKQESQKLEQFAQLRRELRAELDRAAIAIEETFGDGLVIDARVRLVELSNASYALLETESAQDISGQVDSLKDGLLRYRQLSQEWQAEKQAIAERTPPPALERVAASYFAGDYEFVSQEVDPATFADRRHKVQAHLFRAAARFNLFWLRGKSDSALIESAGDDIAEIKRLDADFQPYVAAFSPRFLVFFGDN